MVQTLVADPARGEEPPRRGPAGGGARPSPAFEDGDGLAELAAGLAHEVRNPLAIIAGTAVRLKRRYAPAEQPDPLFDSIPEEVERLNGIVEGYLRFARDEPLTLVDCDLRDVLERGERLVRDELASRRVELSRRVPERPVSARADPQRLQQVLLNLLLNAAQAMPQGGAVELSLEEAGQRALVRVADRGPGFGAKELKSAFTPFYTTKDKGSGLGLVMTRRIVEAHGGAIRLENRDGGGAVVTIECEGRKQAQPVLGSSSYLSWGDLRAYFGVGPVDSVKIRASTTIHWPSGTVQRLEGLALGRYHDVSEPPSP